MDLSGEEEISDIVVKLDPEMQDRLEQLNRETFARWQEAEQGRVISHQAVSKWLDTWGTDEESSRPKLEF